MENEELRQKYWEFVGDKTWECNKCGKETHRLGPHMDTHAQIHESATSDLDSIKQQIKAYKWDLMPYHAQSKKLNLPIEQIKELGKEFPWRDTHGNKTEKRENMSQSRKTLSVKVVSRFLKDEALEEFLKSYRNNLRSVGGTDRKTIFEQPIPKEDLELLRVYVTDFETSLDQSAKEKGMSKGNFYTKVLRVAAKVVFKHPEIIDQILSEPENVV